MSSRPDYGIDSPAIVVGLFLVSAGAFALALILRVFAAPHPLGQIASLGVGVYFLLAGGGMIWYSRVGKLQNRDSVLNGIAWRGDELVLDVGCGRGLLLSGVARRLRTGKAIGLDRWVSGALAGNKPQNAVRNTELEGITDRVALITGDVLRLPFVDDCFDVVVSNFVLHEVNNAAEREQMLREMARVVKPGGRLALVDFIFTGEGVETFRNLGISNLSRRRLGSSFSFWFSAILNFGLVQTCQVTGDKPINERSPNDGPRVVPEEA